MKQWTWMSSISSTTLPHMTFVCKISVFTCKPWENLNWLFVLGYSLLGPTFNNLKTVLPEILRCLVPECPKSSAWFLTPFPPWVWAVKEPGWCTRNFRSCSYPFRHWSASEHSLLPVRLSLFSFCTDLVLLSEEELVHRCHHVSVQINKIVVCCACCRFSLYCLCHVGYKCVWNVQSWGLYWGSVGSDLCVTWQGGCGLICAWPYHEG